MFCQWAVSVCTAGEGGVFLSCCMTVCWTETCENKALEKIASQDQKLEIQAYADKLAVIKEVLARRHMKVAFFGR